MQRFVVTGKALTVNGGVLALSKEQAAARGHNLETIDAKEGLYKVLRTVTFKKGEEIGHDGDLPKAVAHLVESSDSKNQEDNVTLDQFRAAVAKLDPTNDEHRTADGKPDVKALKGVGVKVTAAQRDDLWRQLEEAEAEKDPGE